MVTTPLRGAYTSIAGLPACRDFHDELAYSVEESNSQSPHAARAQMVAPHTCCPSTHEPCTPRSPCGRDLAEIIKASCAPARAANAATQAGLLEAGLHEAGLSPR